MKDTKTSKPFLSNNFTDFINALISSDISLLTKILKA